MTAKEKKTASYRGGLRAEYFAAFILLCKGYRLLAWRFKTPVGEIDIVARKGRTIVFAEVKMRPSIEEGLGCLTARMQNRITRAAQYFMSGKPHLGMLDQRFDFIAVAPPCRLRHIKNAWIL